jgi:hypothetical protein
MFVKCGIHFTDTAPRQINYKALAPSIHTSLNTMSMLMALLLGIQKTWVQILAHRVTILNEEFITLSITQIK